VVSWAKAGISSKKIEAKRRKIKNKRKAPAFIILLSEFSKKALVSRANAVALTGATAAGMSGCRWGSL
jgi:hypothetical protein